MPIYTFGPFRLDTAAAILFRRGEPVALGRRAVGLLGVLAERSPLPVAKEALIETGWAGRSVEGSNLTVQIAALRRALSEVRGGDRWIETLPRRGYRFVAPIVVEAENGNTPPPSRVDAAPTRHGEAERRQVTALSCALVGAAPGADGSALEDLREAVGAFRRCVAETAGRRDGFIAGHLGNNLLVLFGYPAAHEHDAEQAVRTGLELCAAVKRSSATVPMRCRVGIATGMVIAGDLVGVGELGKDEPGDHEPGGHEIVGEAPTVAARLQASTPPDTVAIGPVTRQLIGKLFDCRELGAIDAKNGAAPLRGWQVLRESIVASRFEALRGPALSPLIGRDEEIDLLLRRWGRAKAGDGQIVLVSGEAGLGKSRIAAAFAERLDAEPHLYRRYFCSPHHQDSALYPFIDQLGRAAGFARDDAQAARLEKLGALLAQAALPDEDMAFLAELLSLPNSERRKLPSLSAQRKKERTLEALIRLLEGVARRQPVLMVFEDAHWIDPTSRELLDLLVERVPGLPVLLIVTFRPELQPPWTGRTQLTMLTLNRLDRHDRIALVEQITRGRALPDEVIQQIADRTDGVPLFVEELTKSVLENGLLRQERDRYVLDRAVPTLAIPATLHASLTARLDRLASARRAAQIGAAIGREFPFGLLRAVARLPEGELQAALASLVASELVFQRGTPPEAVYAFKHALVQDAAHGSLLRTARRRLHGRIAEALEAHTPELMDTQPEVFARHYAEARDRRKIRGVLEQGGSEIRRPLGDGGSGGAISQGAGSAGAVARHPRTPAPGARILERVGCGFTSRQRSGGAGNRPSLCVRTRTVGAAGLPLGIPPGAVRAVALSLGSRRARPGAPLGPGIAASEPPSEAFRGICSQSSVRRTDADVCRKLCFIAIASGRDAGALRAKFLRLAIPPDRNPSACQLPGVSGACPFLLRLSRSGVRTQQHGNRRGPEAGSSDVSRCGLGIWRAVAFARRQGAVYRGWVKVRNGDVTEGISLLRSGAAAYRATGAELYMPHYTALLAEACEIAGQIGEASSLLHDALQIVERTGERWLAAELNRRQGHLLLRQMQCEAAEEFYRKARTIAEQQGAKLWERRAALSLARLRRDQRRRAEAHDLLAPVSNWFTEGFDTPDLKAAKALLSELDDRV